MAAIDFPASPTVGQAFAANNGVVYTWNGILWLASGASAGGDFMATNSSPFTLGGAGVVISWNTVQTGNSGGWYNTSTGRYTPPAGRYFIASEFTGYLGTAATTVAIELWKNGVLYVGNNQTAPIANNWFNPTFNVVVDSNGTDYWQVVGSASAGTTSTGGRFLAYPISGIQGPPGPYPSGALYLYSEQVLSVAGATLVVTIPTTPKVVRLQWSTNTAGAVNDNIWLQAMVSGTPYTTANYETQQLNGTSATATAQIFTAQIGYHVAGGLISEGWWETSWLPFNIAQGHLGHGQSFEIQTAGVRMVRHLGTYFNTLAPAANAITGFRLAPATNNFAAGSYLRCFVSP